MSTITSPRKSVQPRSRKPVVAELCLTINGVGYVLIPTAPGSAYRLVKDGCVDSVYDVCRTHSGLVECDCPSYEATYRGNGLATCKHGQALVLVGLLEAPKHVDMPMGRNRDNITVTVPAAAEVNRDNVTVEPPAFVHVPDEFDEPAPVQDRLVQRFAEADPARVAAFDRAPYIAQNAVAEGRALYLAHRHLHTSEPPPGPSADHARDIVILDDAGQPLETPSEMDARHRAEHAAKVVELMDGNPFVGLNPFSPDGCCPADEPSPCQACVTHDGPADLSDAGWQDEFRWAVNGTIARSLAEQVDEHARGLRAMGSPLGDLLAERAEALAAEVRFLDASTVGQYRDRHEAMLEGARASVEARESTCR